MSPSVTLENYLYFVHRYLYRNYCVLNAVTSFKPISALNPFLPHHFPIIGSITSDGDHLLRFVSFITMLLVCSLYTHVAPFINQLDLLKDVKKQIRDDPRYERYSTSEKKCEKEFYSWLKDKTAKARDEYKVLLQVKE